MRLFDHTDEGFVPHGFVPDLTSYDLILINTSGGKDSQAAMDRVVGLADEQGVPRRNLVALHADLGEMEWDETEETVRRHANHYGLRLKVRRRRGENLLQSVERRGKWPDAARRWCTSDFKRGPLATVLTTLVDDFNMRRNVPKRKVLAKLGIRPVRVLSVMGFRAEESPARARRAVFARDHRASNGKREVDLWFPIHSWTVAQVWNAIRASGLQPHPIYTSGGLTRASCSLCVLGSKADLIRAARLRPELARRYAAVEERIGHRFRKDLSMAEILQLADKTPRDPEEPDQ